MLTKLPDEIIRKIIILLPVDDFISLTIVSKDVYRLQQHRLLIGWGLEGICLKYTDVMESIHKRYIQHDKIKGVLYCMYDMIFGISHMIGDNCYWDCYDVQYHDIVYRLMYNIEPWDKNKKIIEYLFSNNIPVQYHKRILNSRLLQVLL